MDNNKNKILTLIAIITIILTLIGATYAYFAAQAGGTTSTNATVTSNTTDLLTFSMNQDISFTVTQADFAENGNNKSGEATATATLTPNNKTGSATMYYYLYLNLQSNPIVYSAANTNHDPELMLQVFDGNNQLVTLTGLGTEKTIKGVTGYDITGVSGLKTLLDNHAISASNNTATIENWRVVITLINLDVNQNDNTGKQVSGTIVIRQDALTGCDLDPSSCFTLNVSSPASLPGKSVTLTGTGINATWNNKYNQLEISSLGNQNEATITYETPSGTTPLNTYLLSLSGTTQGDGKFVHEIGTVGDFTNSTVIKNYGTTPVFFRNTSSTSTTQTQVDSFWTFDSSTGVFTSDPSKMTTSGNSAYYHAYAQVPETGYYQICYTLAQSSAQSNEFYISISGFSASSETHFQSRTSSQVGEMCLILGLLNTNHYINISEKGYSGTSSPVMTFRIEKDNNPTTFDTGYRYEGKNPNNYVMFNNELWRIIGVFDTEYDSNNNGVINTSGNLVKIIRNDSIETLSSNSNYYPSSTVYHLLNEQYYDWDSNKNYVNDYCYGYNTLHPKCDYSVNGIQEEYRSMIENVNWYFGDGYSSLPENSYLNERDSNYNNFDNGRDLTASGYIGLIYISDYFYGILATDCLRLLNAGTLNCYANNWLYKGIDELTISKYKEQVSLVYDISKSGYVVYKNCYSEAFNIRPVLYLNENVYKVSGVGTATNPYIIGM